MAPTIRGALWMTLAAFAFSMVVMCVRHLSAEIPTVEILFFRNVMGAALMAPWIARRGFSVLRTSQLPRLGLRTLFGFVGAMAWFYCLGVMALGDAVALQFTLPLFTILGAALVLGERIDIPRWIAALAGFLGILVILRPGFTAFAPIALLVLLSAALFASDNLLAKFTVRTESPELIAFYYNFLMIPLTLAFVLFVWVTPSWAELPWALGIGIANGVAQICMTRSFRIADAGAVMPFDFLRLPFTVVLALLLFAEIPDPWSWAGGAIIFASTYFVVWREARQARKKASGSAAS